MTFSLPILKADDYHVCEGVLVGDIDTLDKAFDAIATLTHHIGLLHKIANETRGRRERDADFTEAMGQLHYKEVALSFVHHKRRLLGGGRDRGVARDMRCSRMVAILREAFPEVHGDVEKLYEATLLDKRMHVDER